VRGVKTTEGGEATERPRPRFPVVAALRPRQWIKNVVVLAAPVFSGQFTEPDVLWRSVLTVALFSMASSGVYLLNDVADLVEDRVHPVKRHRPIAAGYVSRGAAAVAASVLVLAACGVGALLSPELGAVLASYVVINLLYSWRLKDEPVIDIAVIALGFVLRAVAGGVASGISLSQWFLLIATFGALYMAAGKRYAEVQLVGEGRAETRPSLSRYSTSYLRFVWSTAAALLIMSYSLWAFEISPGEGIPWTELSMVPFILAVLRYAVDVDAGTAGEPEEIALKDGMLQAIAVAWLVLVVLALYA
jgi:decaprenyl-phosphate phosphoribosyltransferase